MNGSLLKRGRDGKGRRGEEEEEEKHTFQEIFPPIPHVGQTAYFKAKILETEEDEEDEEEEEEEEKGMQEEAKEEEE